MRAFGAEKVVDYGTGALGAEVRNADAVIDTVGGETLEKSYGLLKQGGVLVTIAGQVSEEKARAHGVTARHSGRGPTERLKMIGEMAAAKTTQRRAGKVFPLAPGGSRAGTERDTPRPGTDSSEGVV